MNFKIPFKLHIPKLHCKLSLVHIVLSISIILTLTVISACDNSSHRWEKELSGTGWKLFLDRSAEWKNDSLFIHPENIKLLPVNPPAKGWESLVTSERKDVIVPGTVEGYFWSTPDSTGHQMGDYCGVSWWSKTFDVPSKLKGKRLILAFQSVNLRAEIFVNHILVGYDLIGNTPFDVNISEAVNYGGSNELDIRITDIGGTFSWDDEKALKWGNHSVPSVHGFGGITGKIILRATDNVYVENIYVQNQPTLTEAKVLVTLDNTGLANTDGKLDLMISEWENQGKVILTQSKNVNMAPGQQEVEFDISVPNAELWRIKDPHLYSAKVIFNSTDGTVKDGLDQKFGFRFISVGQKNGDKRLYLNGERVFMLAAMTRGFWPKMGMFPMPGMAERDINVLIRLGYNMIMYHRAIGQPESMDLCDDLGIMSYEEPGGYQSLPYPPSELAQQWRQEKLRRMIIRDRSRVSLTNWNMDDWSYNEPNKWDFENIKMVHALDPSRIVTFNCIQPAVDSIRIQNPFQLHMLPFDTTSYFDGWFSPYHFAAQNGYVDEYYKNPHNFARLMLDKDKTTLGDSSNLVPKDQIYFLGEEGAFGTQLNLEKIKDDLGKFGADGWMDGDYLSWYNSYDTFLNEADLRDAFPTVENLTYKIGHNLHYFHGRIIENVRMMNIADGYVLNGWSGASTNTDIVDTYRHPTGDSTILPYYSQPLYIAVKIRNKVIPAGKNPIADIFLINEKNLKGPHKLELTLKDPDGKDIFTKSFNTEILGGEEFGQLLTEEVIMPATEKNGYYKLEAKLVNQSGLMSATGYDDLFVAEYVKGYVIPQNLSVIDTTGNINSFLRTNFGMILPAFNPTGPRPSAIVLGMHNLKSINIPQILEMVKQGTKLIILENAQNWIASLPVKQLGSAVGRNRSSNGRQFVGYNSLFGGLPQATAMSWEYQVFYRNGGPGLLISPKGLKDVVGVSQTNTGTIGIALCQIPYEKGMVLLSMLNIVPNLNDNRSDCAVAKKLFLNILKSSE